MKSNLQKAIVQAAFVNASAVDQLITNASNGQPLEAPLFHIFASDRHTPMTAMSLAANLVSRDSAELRKSLVEVATAAKTYAANMQAAFA